MYFVIISLLFYFARIFSEYEQNLARLQESHENSTFYFSIVFFFRITYLIQGVNLDRFIMKTGFGYCLYERILSFRCSCSTKQAGIETEAKTRRKIATACSTSTTRECRTL